ncbi:MAG: aminotransferase class I/II-fold pyridoxal phosphate-dependent enzyme, partial [Rhodospirillales bacterium]|nr:aminotransferase class I/II-fold pyridoxal phosphate-dependent enzyme [Rhodospirillales bacterium]
MSSDPSNSGIPLSTPWLCGNEEAYLRECVETNWVSSAGAFVTRFETALANYVGRNHAVAVVNGTAALHTALMVAGVGPGDCVLTSTMTFVATANAIRHAGAYPVFIDVDPETWQIDPILVSDFLSNDCERRDQSVFDRKTGRRVGAVLPVHILGHPADMDPILSTAREFDLPVIEDATESLGAAYRGRKAGALGDIACFSFNGNKLVTCGGGGM